MATRSPPDHMESVGRRLLLRLLTLSFNYRFKAARETSLQEQIINKSFQRASRLETAALTTVSFLTALISVLLLQL